VLAADPITALIRASIAASQRVVQLPRKILSWKEEGGGKGNVGSLRPADGGFACSPRHCKRSRVMLLFVLKVKEEGGGKKKKKRGRETILAALTISAPII